MIAKIKAKDRDNWTCLHCGRSKEQGYQMHGSHIYPEGVYLSMSAEVDNILTLCAKCHVGGGAWKNKSIPSWHEDPVYFADWYREKFPELYLKLRKMSQTSEVINWEIRHKEMKAWKENA